MDELTHLDKKGRARMVDVGEKPVTKRAARASATVRTRPDVIRKISGGETPKGDVLAAARLAGIMAAKRTPDLIPLCHPLSIDSVSVQLSLSEDSVKIESRVACTGKTGVEMEALTAASVAALTVYDMCKAVDREMTIEHVRLEEKAGGESGHFIRGDRR